MKNYFVITVCLLLGSAPALAGFDRCIGEENKDLSVNVYFNTAENRVTGMEYSLGSKKVRYGEVISKMLLQKQPRAANFTGRKIGDTTEVGVLVLSIFKETPDQASGTFTLVSGNGVSVENVSCEHQS